MFKLSISDIGCHMLQTGVYVDWDQSSFLCISMIKHVIKRVKQFKKNGVTVRAHFNETAVEK